MIQACFCAQLRMVFILILLKGLGLHVCLPMLMYPYVNLLFCPFLQVLIHCFHEWFIRRVRLVIHLCFVSFGSNAILQAVLHPAQADSGLKVTRRITSPVDFLGVVIQSAKACDNRAVPQFAGQTALDGYG